MSDHVTNLTDATFDDFLTGSKVPTLVDFTATWCPPCQVVGPIVHKLAEKYAGKLNVGVADVDHCEKVAQQYGVQAVPTLLIFQGEEVVAQLVGALPKAEIEEELKKFLPKV
jgi:thioredoxin 1